MEDEHLVGYCDRFSVKPGENLDVKVSTTAETYTTKLVRLSHSEDKNGAPSIHETEIPNALPRRIPGRVQEATCGSFIYVPELGKDLCSLHSWSVRCWIRPTLLSGQRSQVLMSTLSAPSGAGWELLISSDNRLAFRVHGDNETAEVRVDDELREHRWYAVVAGYDDANGEMLLMLRDRDKPQHQASFGRYAARPGNLEGSGPHLSMAARHTGDRVGSGWRTEAHFNGRIEAVSIYSRAPESITSDSTGRPSLDGVAAYWDFAEDMTSARITGHGPLGRDGVVVHMPARAVAGHNWTGEHLDFRQNAHHYGAIHFHDDDVHETGWDTDFTLPVPQDLTSGVYAVKCVSAGMIDHIPFVVTPAPSHHRSKALVILPSFTYLAYANVRLDVVHDYQSGRNVEGTIAAEPSLALLRKHPDWGRSLYDVHSDGSGWMYASWKRPLLDVRPGYTNPVTGGPREFSADLCLLHWLEHTGIDVDVITDNELHHDGIDAIAPYQVVLTGSHPEYCTDAMRQALERYAKQGGRLMYLGGNGFYWVTSVHPQHPDVIEVRRGHSGTRAWTSDAGEVHHSTTGEPAGLWRHRGRAPNELVGVGFTGLGWDDKAGHYQRLPASYEPEYSWIFDEVGADEPIGDFGLVMDGAAGDEIDRHDPGLGGADAVVLASSVGHSDHYCIAVEELTQTTPAVTASTNDRVRADMVYMAADGGGGVFSVGSMCWVPALPINGCENNVARITENVLRRFLSKVPLPHQARAARSQSSTSPACS